MANIPDIAIAEKSDALTCAVVIGVSQYKSESIPNLSFAGTDAISFANLLREFGITEIFELTNKSATRASVIDVIAKTIPLRFTSTSGSKRLIVYFSGHGMREQRTGDLPKSILLTWDTDASNKGLTGISLQDLVDAIRRSDPDEIFVFIDACSAQFDHLANIFDPTSAEKEVFAGAVAKHFFAYVASAQQAAYENTTIRAGVFTECLIRNIRHIQNNGGNISDLTNVINEEINAKGKQNPQCYSIGNKQTWIFSNAPTQITAINSSHLHSELFIDRSELLESLRSLVMSETKTIYVYGKSGVGKSTLVRRLLTDGFSGAYLSIPISADGASVQGIVADLAYQMVSVFPSGRPLESVDATLNYFKDNVSNELIVIDHTERNPRLTQEIIRKFSEHSIRAILVGRTVVVSPSDSIMTWECPLLSKTEVERFLFSIKHKNPYDSFTVLTQSNGLPINLISIISEPKTATDNDLQYCFEALSSTGGFVDERVFKTVFSVNPILLDSLIAEGKITFIEDRFIPHDSVITTHNIAPEQVYHYWDEQVKRTPTHSWACKQLVYTILNQHAELDVLHTTESSSLNYATKRLFESKEWDLLKALTKTLIAKYPNQITDLLSLAKIFVHRSNNIIVNEIQQSLNGQQLSVEQSYLYDTVEAERLWWNGDYENSINICLSLLEKPVSIELEYESKMHMGIAYFFLGEWEKALNSFAFSDDIFNEAKPQVNGWALYLSATILGLRGTNIKKSKDQFYSGIRLLEQIGDDSGTASAWGNMAEMNWKLREYESALVQAKRGYNIAKETDHIIDQIEIMRNILHISMRLYSPYDQSVINAIEIINGLIRDDIGETVEMQVWNTFATLYAYRGDTAQLKEMVDKAYQHTVSNREYHIYTLSNMCLFSILEGDVVNAKKYYTETINKANEGNNLLAMRQINDDIQYIDSHFHSSSSETVCCFIAPYINDVESKILSQIKET